MILTTLLFGGALLTGTLAVAYWDDLKSWLMTAMRNTARMIRGILIGAKIFIKRVGTVYQEVAKMYSQDETEQWHLTTTTRTVLEDEIPIEIRQIAKNNQETDITNRLEQQLSLH